MRKAWVVAKREFLERVRTRQFIIGTVLGPVLMGALFVVPILLSSPSSSKRIVIVDAADGEFGAKVEAALARSMIDGGDEGERPRFFVSRIPAAGRAAEVRDSLIATVGQEDEGEEALTGVLVVSDRVLTSDSLEYFGSNVTSLSEMGIMSRLVRDVAVSERLTRLGIEPSLLMEAIRPIDLVTTRVSRGKATGESGESSFMLAYVMSLLLYMALLIYGMQVMTSTVEEKTNRINEVLVSSLRPFELLLGKVVGVGSVGLLQMGIWVGTAYGIATARAPLAKLAGVSAEAVSALPIPEIPLGLVLVFLLYFLLGFFFYSAAYAAVGSTCNTVQETQQAQMPVTLMIVAGLMVMFKLLNEPNGQLAQILSLVPPLAPFVVPVRYSLSPLPLPELALSVVVTGLGVLGMAWVAGRIYRVGILMYGKKASFREIFRWIRAG
ncbi:MAG: ABC transporter permease [Gemmatimonadota bacterium]